jgi:lipoprotein-anchoring transpeptidase ErfK/SrfK
VTRRVDTTSGGGSLGDRKAQGGRSRFATLALAALLSATCAALPVAATGLTINAPARTSGSTDVTVMLEAGEGPGTVTLYDRSVVLGETPSAEGVAQFPGLTFANGQHSLNAVLTAAGGERWTSPVVPLFASGAPGQPRIVSPTKKCVVSPVAVVALAGADTATLTLEVDGVAVRSVACIPGQVVHLGSATLRKGPNVLTVVAASPSGQFSAASRTVTRYEWPCSTCIVVDKSDYRLYWVKGQQLIASYKVAHGRNNWTPVGTWKILAKYRTDPRSVYGPRKMRMFRRVGPSGHYRFVYTRYGIHGTNQPSSIGHQASHGCIRMYSKDVLKLWPQVRIGTYVVTRP